MIVVNTVLDRQNKPLVVDTSSRVPPMLSPLMSEHTKQEIDQISR